MSNFSFTFSLLIIMFHNCYLLYSILLYIFFYIIVPCLVDIMVKEMHMENDGVVVEDI